MSAFAIPIFVAPDRSARLHLGTVLAEHVCRLSKPFFDVPDRHKFRRVLLHLFPPGLRTTEISMDKLAEHGQAACDDTSSTFNDRPENNIRNVVCEVRLAISLTRAKAIQALLTKQVHRI